MNIEERLEKLEKGLARARRWNRLLMIIVIMVFSLLAIAATSDISSREKIVEAKRFNLLDDNGKTRAFLAVDANSAVLTLSDENEKPCFVLRASKDGSVLGLSKNGKLRATLGLLLDMPPMLSLCDENGKPRASLTVNKDGPSLDLSGENGKSCVMLNVTELGTGLIVSDENGKHLAGLTALKNGPTLWLRDDNGNTRASLSVNKDGPALSLSDQNGEHRAGLGINKTTTPDGKVVTYPESSLLLFDPNGKVIWEAPW